MENSGNANQHGASASAHQAARQQRRIKSAAWQYHRRASAA